jgi:hypothetical protein
MGMLCSNIFASSFAYDMIIAGAGFAREIIEIGVY